MAIDVELDAVAVTHRLNSSIVWCSMASPPGLLLDELMALASEEPASGSVTYAGEDPIFPTPFRIGDLGAAAIGAAAVEAARLWQDKTGRSQRIHIDVDAAAIAMRSSRYIRVAPPPPGSEAGRPNRAGGGLGIYRTKDERWIYFQVLFQHHRDRLARTLGLPSYEPDRLPEAVAAWNGQELEDAVVANGATAGLVRTNAEWAAHPHAQALAQLPLLEITRIEGAPARALPAGDRPLSGMRVLDVTRVLAGPTCGRTLAEHGADVLRVGTPKMPDNEAMMRDTGHGKRSTVLDLTAPADADRLRTLIADADVFSQGYRPGAIASLGFSPEEVAAMRPGIVYVTISAFGHDGPWRNRRGFDSVVQAVSGIADEAAADGRPRFLPANPLDYTTGYLAAFATMAAVRRRAREGGSWHVRLSLAQTGRFLAGMSRAAGWEARPPELPPERLEELMTITDTPFGPLKHFTPVAQMSETPGRWERPTAPLDNDPPRWSAA
jgi:crotonobetainyl-CoA:carnitine CoA-transferase CaiB-like acyl-CoA transferase